jgi:hypothetical protein
MSVACVTVTCDQTVSSSRCIAIDLRTSEAGRRFKYDLSNNCSRKALEGSDDADLVDDPDPSPNFPDGPPVMKVSSRTLPILSLGKHSAGSTNLMLLYSACFWRYRQCLTTQWMISLLTATGSSAMCLTKAGTQTKTKVLSCHEGTCKVNRFQLLTLLTVKLTWAVSKVMSICLSV